MYWKVSHYDIIRKFSSTYNEIMTHEGVFEIITVPTYYFKYDT